MSFPRVPSLLITARIFTKAFIVVIILNFICLVAKFNPVDSITQLNLWGVVGNGRARLVYMSDFNNGLLPLNSLLATHIIAHTPKKSNEYRVIIIGNSGPFGSGLDDNETLVAQLNGRKILVGDKLLVAYNLGYPSATVITEAMTIDAVARYEPDFVFSFVTAYMFNNRQAYLDQIYPFMRSNRPRLEALANRFRLAEWLSPRLSPRPILSNWIGIHDDGTLPVWFGSLFYPFVSPDLSRTSLRIANKPMPDKPNNFQDVPGTYPILNDAWLFLNVAQQISITAGARFLVVNQPTLVNDGPHSELSYSALYGRTFYDAYHKTIAAYTKENDIDYLDLWQIVPPEHYTDSELHMDADGWAIVADHLINYLENIDY